MKRTGVLLINLGTPDAPTPAAVGRYLREFLMDRFVMDIPAVWRWLLVNVVIVPRRKKQSARLYQKIHTEQGSPLQVNTRELARAVANQLVYRNGSYVVEFAMRYGQPSISSALAKLCAARVSRILTLPIYPQYAESSFETAVVETKRNAGELGCAELVSFLAPFYDEPGYIGSCAEHIAEHLEQKSPQHLVFSFHGLPVRHVKRLDLTKEHCLIKRDCCRQITEVNRNCYRAQSFVTARAIAGRLGLKEESYTVSFQSRLGRAEWLEPQTEVVLRQLAGTGVRRLAVFSPSFVVDCLETLEEIAIRGREVFMNAGGDEFTLVPSLNIHPRWVTTVADWIADEC